MIFLFVGIIVGFKRRKITYYTLLSNTITTEICITSCKIYSIVYLL